MATKKQRLDDEELLADAQASRYEGCSVQELMKAYYAKLYPHQQMYKWLVYGNDSNRPQADTDYFQRREFCFTMDGDIFVRYQSFKDGTQLADAIVKKCPSKIDIGPVYSCNPQDRLKYQGTFIPVERELVFDIDLTDYDDVRTCGKEGHICTKCWPLMAVAIKVIDRGLREDFGFSDILWVYSGRRGVHCWVCDPSARCLTDEQRSAVAAYFSINKGHENGRVKLALGGGTHPAVEAAAEVLRQAWEEDILPGQQLLQDETMRTNMLKYLPEPDLAAAVEKSWGKAPALARQKGEDVDALRWRQLTEAVEDRVAEAKAKKDFKAQRPLERCVTEIIFAHTYPRLDVEVSKKMNHLLKAPFCVHPKTGKVCVPLDPEKAHLFDPEDVPTVHTLLDQLPAAMQGNTQRVEEEEGWRHTDLAPCIEMFERAFLKGCQKASEKVLNAKAAVARVASEAGGSW